MKYTQIQRTNTEDFITIGEYIKETQPKVAAKILWMIHKDALKTVTKRTWNTIKDVVIDITELVTAAADVSGIDKLYKKLMEEKPRRR